MTCCVCPRGAVIEVDHNRLGVWYAYCRFHGYNKEGHLRWDAPTRRPKP